MRTRPSPWWLRRLLAALALLGVLFAFVVVAGLSRWGIDPQDEAALNVVFVGSVLALLSSLLLVKRTRRWASYGIVGSCAVAAFGYSELGAGGLSALVLASGATAATLGWRVWPPQGGSSSRP